jgi:hypothetical protein
MGTAWKHRDVMMMAKSRCAEKKKDLREVGNVEIPLQNQSQTTPGGPRPSKSTQTDIQRPNVQDNLCNILEDEAYRSDH